MDMPDCVLTILVAECLPSEDDLVGMTAEDESSLSLPLHPDNFESVLLWTSTHGESVLAFEVHTCYPELVESLLANLPNLKSFKFYFNSAGQGSGNAFDFSKIINPSLLETVLIDAEHGSMHVTNLTLDVLSSVTWLDISAAGLPAFNIAPLETLEKLCCDSQRVGNLPPNLRYIDLWRTGVETGAFDNLTCLQHLILPTEPFRCAAKLPEAVWHTLETLVLDMAKIPSVLPETRIARPPCRQEPTLHIVIGVNGEFSWDNKCMHDMWKVRDLVKKVSFAIYSISTTVDDVRALLDRGAAALGPAVQLEVFSLWTMHPSQYAHGFLYKNFSM